MQSHADLLSSALREAGALVLRLSRGTLKKWNKPDGSLVTEADLQVDTFLKDRLRAGRAEYGWLSEETPDSTDRLHCRRLWIVDPIDGTTDFARGGNEWCIGAALIEDGAPLVSGIYRPVVDEFYWAAKGNGAFCNGRRLQVRPFKRLSGCEIMATGRAAKSLSGAGVTPSPVSMPLLMRLAFVAAGKTDMAMSFGNKNDWDLAAGHLLVEEAGGRISILDGNDMVYNKPDPWQNGMIAATPELHHAVLRQLEQK